LRSQISSQTKSTYDYSSLPAVYELPGDLENQSIRSYDEEQFSDHFDEEFEKSQVSAKEDTGKILVAED
jgi:hypothetical protein